MFLRIWSQDDAFSFLFFFNIYYSFWLCRVLVAAHGIFAAACRIFWLWHSMRDLVPQPGIEPGLPCIGSSESYPLDHRGSPKMMLFLITVRAWWKTRIARVTPDLFNQNLWLGSVRICMLTGSPRWFWCSLIANSLCREKRRWKSSCIPTGWSITF